LSLKKLKSSDIFLKAGIFFVTGFYIGKIPVAPGTFGSIPGIFLAFLLNSLNPFLALAVFFLIFFIAVLLCGFVCKRKGIHDPGYIVIDEILGMAVSLMWIEMSVINVIMCFMVFRFFDIIKPFPINYFDKKIKGGLGIVFDDITAGLFTNILVNLFIKVMI